ncbi:MAG: homoserine dehydrogenase [Clostridia bacterium]|nr:homoserine dehydrogenase [Clostridia bacterium]
MYVAVMGCGIVGSGVVRLISKNREGIKKRRMTDLEVKHILDIRDFPDSPFAELFTKDFNDILGDDDVKVVVETMGGLHPAFEYVSACLKAGKSVVSSNKLLVSQKGYELLQLAKDNNVNFLFEASVAGGIPIIRPIVQCLAANEVEEIAGILNGTTNFILTKMIVEKMSFADALALAQKNGYAEADPTADIEGLDACRKICILASIAFGSHVYPESVYTEGITSISESDVAYANDMGAVIKLIANAKKISDDKIEIATAPAIIFRGSQLAGVSDEYNAVLVRGDAIGDVVFYGKGAGRFATASAVVADVADCAIHLERRKYFGWDEAKENYVSDYGKHQQKFMVRVETDDAGAVRKVFGDVRVLNRENAPENEFAFVTPVMSLDEVKRELASLPVTIGNIIRITDY